MLVFSDIIIFIQTFFNQEVYNNLLVHIIQPTEESDALDYINSFKLDDISKINTVCLINCWEKKLIWSDNMSTSI